MWEARRRRAVRLALYYPPSRPVNVAVGVRRLAAAFACGANGAAIVNSPPFHATSAAGSTSGGAAHENRRLRPLSNPSPLPSYVNALACRRERGFHSLWFAEHVVLFDDIARALSLSDTGKIPVRRSGIIDPFLALAFVAATTKTIRLGTGICLVPQRNPVYTAKEVATLDYLSGGRVDFGVGIGWLEEEFRALGVPFERRAGRTRAYLEVMRRFSDRGPIRGRVLHSASLSHDRSRAEAAFRRSTRGESDAR